MIKIDKIALIAATALATIAPLNASAVILLKESRSLESCTDAIEKSVRGQMTDTFYRQREDGNHEIYANVLQYENGELVPMRVTCQTNANGRRVVDVQAQAGRWVEDDRG